MKDEADSANYEVMIRMSIPRYGDEELCEKKDLKNILAWIAQRF